MGSDGTMNGGGGINEGSGVVNEGRGERLKHAIKNLWKNISKTVKIMVFCRRHPIL